MILAPIKLEKDDTALDYTNQIKNISDYYKELSNTLKYYDRTVTQFLPSLSPKVKKRAEIKLQNYEEEFEELANRGRKPIGAENYDEFLNKYFKKTLEKNKLNNVDALKQIATQYYQNFDIFKADPLNAEAKNQMKSLMAAMQSIDADYAKNVEKYANAQDFSIKRTVNNLKNKKFVLKDTASAEKRASKVSKEYNNNLKKQATQAKATAIAQGILNAALQMGIGYLISIIVNGLVSYVDSLILTKEEAAELAEEINAAFDEINSKLQENKKLADESVGRYEKLAKGVNTFGENVALTDEEFAEYNELSNEIAERFPQLVQGYTDTGDAILTCRNNVELLNEAIHEDKQKIILYLSWIKKRLTRKDILLP